MELKSRTKENVKILDLKGRFDAHERPQVQHWLEWACAQTPANILINLDGVHFIDSTGLSVLVQGMKHCRQQKGDLWLCNLQQPVRIIFELTRLNKALEIFESEEEFFQTVAAR